MGLLSLTELDPRGSGVYLRELEDGPYWGAGSAHGGYVMALLLHAMALELGDPARQPRSLSQQFLGRVKPGLGRIEVAIERNGRSVSSLRARLRMKDDTLAVASAVFASDREGPEFNDDTRPEVEAPSRPDSNMMGFDFAPVHQRFEFHRRFGADGDVLPCEDGGWVLPREREDWDYRLALVISDLWCPPTIRHSERVAATPSLHHVVHLAPGAAGSASENFLVRHTASHAGAGLTDEDISLWSGDGRLLLRGRQLRQVVDPARMIAAL